MKRFLKKFIPGFLLSFYHYSLALIGAFLYGFPSRLRQGYGGQKEKLIVIGITGTSGKSTVVDLTHRILEEAGYKTASLSSIRFKIEKREWLNALKMTMPGRFKLQKFLREAVNASCKYAVLEVTSEGIKQHRHRFIDFDIAVFTNLSPEHIEAHNGFENYKKEKGKLFQATKNIHIVNSDDENVGYFLQIPSKMKYEYTITENCKLKIENCIKAVNVKMSESGIDFVINNTQFNMRLLGGFNVYNALTAICIGLSQGVPLKICKRALEKASGIPGRMEVVVEKPFKVIVDYAITPVALEKVYKTLIAHYLSSVNKLICVLGACGGGRDKWKRPVFGEIAAKYCREIIITNEDPYDEDPNQILSQIKSGITKSQFPIINFYEILDRREAIKKALKLARSGDVVIITGKGSEPWMCLEGGKKIPWDDRQVVREQFKNLKFKILPHTADLKIQAYGATKEELFLNMLLGMQESLKSEVREPEEKTKREIKIKSIDLSALIVDFLSEVLYLIQINKEIYNDIKFKKFSDTEIEAELTGQKAERFGEDIKAVTYHQLDIYQRNDGNWEAIVLFDI